MCIKNRNGMLQIVKLVYTKNLIVPGSTKNGAKLANDMPTSSSKIIDLLDVSYRLFISFSRKERMTLLYQAAFFTYVLKPAELAAA